MVPDSDPRDGYFYLPLTPMIDPYKTAQPSKEMTTMQALLCLLLSYCLVPTLTLWVPPSILPTLLSVFSMFTRLRIVYSEKEKKKTDLIPFPY